MSATQGALQRWQRLIDQPLDFLGEQPLAAGFPESVGAARLAALRERPRFHSRLLRMVLDHHRLQDPSRLPSPDPDDLPVLLLPPNDFQRLPRLCGAILHGVTLSREIRGDVVSQWRELLGADAFAVALAHRALGGAADLLRTPVELIEAIDQDGARCLSTWLRTQPAQLRPWLHLRFAVPQDQDEPAVPTAVPNAAAIVRCAAASLHQPDEANAR